MTKELTLHDLRGRGRLRWLKSLTFYAFLAFCIWLSQGSTWWTFFTGTIVILAIFGLGASTLKEKTDFRSLDELQAWIDQERAIKQVKTSHAQAQSVAHAARMSSSKQEAAL